MTTTSEKYTDYFGFTEEEVYNPWSIINFLDKGKVSAYWANTSSNSLAGKLIREGSADIKTAFEQLLQGKSIRVEIDEQIVYNQLAAKKNAVWSLLLASGYLKVKKYEAYETEYGEWKEDYELELTNFEVRVMFRSMVRDWFDSSSSSYSDFIKAMLQGDIRAMNIYMNKVTQEMFSYFDTSRGTQGEPERFYHGFVLGLMVELADRYVVTSDRESGFGRYDVMLEPRTAADDAIILEFKVQDEEEKELADTVQEALRQIEERNYQAALIARGIPPERIRKYGFAFCGKKVLIG